MDNLVLSRVMYRMTFRKLFLVVCGIAHVSGCGCDDIGCHDLVNLTTSAARDVARVELQTSDGWIECSTSTQTRCSVSTMGDRIEFSFRAAPRQSVEVRVYDAAGDLTSDGPVSLSVKKTDPDGASCPAECDVGTGSLPEP